MSRNFYLSSRPADGGIQRGGSHMRDAIQTRNPNSVVASPLTSRRERFNSGAQLRQPFIDGRELLAGLLFFLIPLASALIVLLSAFFYALLVL